MSNICINKLADDLTIRWVDDTSKTSQEDDSISSEDEGSGCSEGGDGITNLLNMNNKFTQGVWEQDSVWIGLQYLPGAEELTDLIKEDKLAKILLHEHSKITGTLLASYLGKDVILRALLHSGASTEVTDTAGWTLLHLAASAGNLHCVKLLLDNKALVNVWDTNRKLTPLHCAASKGSQPCIKLLLQHSAEVNSGISMAKSPLHFAVQSLAVDCVQELLEAGAIPNTPQVFSEAPIHIAASLGSAEIIKLLLKYGSSVNVQCGTSKSTALHLATEDGNIESVRLLIEAGANISSSNYKKQTPLHIAALCQHSEALELLLKRGANPNFQDIDGRTSLHSAIVKVSRSCECVRTLLTAGANVNQPDAFGYTPLHLAALNEFSNCVLLLINYGGDVTARTKGGVSVLTFITRRTPNVIPKYIKKLDDSIKLTDHEIGDVDCELKLDFRILVPSMVKGETDLLLNFIEVGHREVLKHPLCETFLFLKWRRIRKYFLFSLFYHALYVFLFTAYTIGVFLRDCKSMRRGKMGDACHITLWVKIVGYMLIVLNMLLLTKELFQIAHSWFIYIKEWENWLQWLILMSVFCCVVPSYEDIRQNMYSWQHHVAAVGIFLTWLELMMIVGRFPIFGLYIQMFTTVAVNFSKFLLAYLCLLIAFGLSFGVLFANYPPFNNIVWGIMKTIIMMSGELEFEDTFYGDFPIVYPVTAHIMFLAFVLLVTVILTNLMVGLAVSDIQGLQQSAGLDRIVRQAELVAHLESMLFSRLLRWIPTRFLAFFYKHALLLKSQQHWALYIRPNDPREERIPRDLIKNIYDLVAERKERTKRKRKSIKRSVTDLNNFANGNSCHVSRMNSSYDYSVMSGRFDKISEDFNECQFQYFPK